MIMAVTTTDDVTTVNLPAVLAKPSEVAKIAASIKIDDRAQLSSYGENAQRSVTAFADKILEQTRNKDMGNAGKL
jgi:uncharacterized protein YaaN involved in tellurite resistance